ncbi:hypothetical protein LOC68_01870 [Blastopirellula sp. JC732]|uniref:Glutamine amidotransferase domain-containing protein n=1 Tax=Blastopirellula sediminis TaxID=2894196 RepID=A0A9X1MHE9_9BACT|nr:hypothetical protein [Blastopirellula sediminis]MCC9608064.1 hypothetical protein [Blastopirellula sediminis]MCC9627143.1 hypothetical protein [Blastopirellula sediminis]
MTTTAQLTFLWTPWTLALAIAAFLVMAGCSYFAWRRSGYRWSIATLEFFRLALFAMAGVLLNQPEYVEEFRPKERPTVVVLWDDSRSMQTADVVASEGSSPTAQTRAEAISPVLSKSAWAPLEERIDVSIQPISAAGSSNGTDLYAPLVGAAEKSQDLLGIVLVSDGDWNEGEPPVEASAQLRLKKIPVITIPVGSSTRLPDVQLLSLDAPTFGVAGKSVRIPFSIESSLPREFLATIRLKDSSGGEVTKEVRVAAQGRTTDAIVWQPTDLGDYTVTVEIPVQQGELIADNNSLSAPIAIREEKLRVLIVESSPRWEYRYLRNALSRDPGVDVSCLLFHPGLSKVGGGNSDYIKTFPEGRDELSEYDVIFLGDVGLDDGQLTAEQCRLIAGLVEKQASGLVFLPGWQGRQLSLLDTELGKLYPVVMDPAQPGGWGSRVADHFALTAEGRTSLLTKLADTAEENIEVWEGLPGFQWYAPVTRAKAGSNVLCVHKDASNNYGRIPLLATRTYGSGKVLFMGTDGAWRWRKGVEDKYHYRFWGQVVRWMAYQRNMAEGQSMRLYYSPDQPQLGQTTMLHANVMTNSGEPLTNGELTAAIIAPSGAIENLRFTSTGDEWGAFAAQFTSREPGMHKVTLTSPQTDATLDASFFVQGSSIEPIGEPARPEVLEEIARVTNGKVLQITQVNDVINYLQTLPSPPPAVRRLQIWSHPLTVAILILLLCGFWIARKVAGLI